MNKFKNKKIFSYFLTSNQEPNDKPTKTDYKLLLEKINVDNEFGHCEKLLENIF
jgi:hypothetical protein